MANWKHKIELNQVVAQMNDKYDLSDGGVDCPEEVKTAIVAELGKVPAVFNSVIPWVEDSISIEDLNKVLQQVFDQADNSLVWCGLPYDEIGVENVSSI